MTDRQALPDRLRVVAATPIPEELAQVIREREPRVDFVVEHDLLPSMRYPGDHPGNPSFRRTPEAQARFEALVDSAQVLYGIPDEKPAALRRAADANPQLLWVQTMAAGGGAQLRAANLTEEQLGRIRFTTSAGVHEAPLAEFAVLGLLAGLKDLGRMLGQKARHEWPADRSGVLRQLAGSSVLIVGLGHIGRETAAKLSALGVHVDGTSRRDVSVDGVRRVVHPDRLAEVAGDYDGIVVTLPGTARTEHLVGGEVLARVRPGVVIVNVGRGSVIDETALLGALDDGRVGFAALDVFEREPLDVASPLWDVPNVLVYPHVAALSASEDRLIAELFAQNATRFLDGRDLLNPVNTREFY